MDSIPRNKSAALIVDASVMVAVCAREAGRFERASTEMANHAQMGGLFFAPGVLFAEVLFALCGKFSRGELTTQQHARSVEILVEYAATILPPPHGDHALVARAEQVRGGYGCSHSADGLYLALTEWLTRTAVAELITFDTGLQRQAAVTAPHLTIRLLTT